MTKTDPRPLTRDAPSTDARQPFEPGYRVVVARPWGGRFSGRASTRLIVVCLIGAALAVAIAALSLATGSYELTLSQVWQALTGQGSALTYTIVVEWRLPRVLLAALFGLALALGGSVFQTLTRNPLGSPDIIGFDTGAYTGALVVLLVLHQASSSLTTIGALIGGLATAAVVYLLAYRHGVHGFRLIIVGIGVSAMLASVNTWLILTASLQDAMNASFWGAGSLNGLGYDQLVPAGIACAILFPALALLSSSLKTLELGDDSARQLGVNINRDSLLLVIVGVGLTATVTALAGPIAFVALAAPQTAKRVTRSAGIPLVASAIVGCVLLLAADFIAQHVFPVELPVGVITVVLGGAYFVWLIIREARRA